jgi:ribosome maturation factor RimP
VKGGASHSLIEVVIDNLAHKTGSASLLDCESISRSLSAIWNERFPDWDYTLQVSSVGATRELVLPVELFRFQRVLLDLSWKDETDKVQSGRYRILCIQNNAVEVEEVPSKKSSSRKKKIRMVPISSIMKGNIAVQI